ncbi:hypothetical protein GCM10010376_09880 [Streptomyces violaceusniger]
MPPARPLRKDGPWLGRYGTAARGQPLRKDGPRLGRYGRTALVRPLQNCGPGPAAAELRAGAAARHTVAPTAAANSRPGGAARPSALRRRRPAPSRLLPRLCGARGVV